MVPLTCETPPTVTDCPVVVKVATRFVISVLYGTVNDMVLLVMTPLTPRIENAVMSFALLGETVT